jgi:hypothetical protein
VSKSSAARVFCEQFLDVRQQVDHELHRLDASDL